jgi:hypothetical protein
MHGTFKAWRDSAHPGWICYVMEVGGETRRLKAKESTALGRWLAAHL